MTDTIAGDILQLLVCPQDKQFLYYQPGVALYNPRLEVSYPIIAGIPMLLATHARPVTDENEKRYLESGQKTGTYEG